MAHRLAAVSVILLLVLCGAFLVAPSALCTDPVEDDLKAIKEFESAGKEAECIAKIEGLKNSHDQRAFAAMNALIASKNDRIACASIRTLVDGWHDGEFFRWLVGRIGDKAFYERKTGRPAVYECILEQLPKYPPEKVKQALKPLGDAVARFMGPEPGFADRAIRAYGVVADRFTVQQLLDWLGQATSGAGAAAKGASKEARESAQKACLETLKALCGQDLPDHAAWKTWWEANAKTFKFPEPSKPSPDARGPDAKRPADKPASEMADPSGLTEFKDDAYGWSVKRPEREGWTFFRPDFQGPRLGLLLGTQAVSYARAYFSVHDPSRGGPKDVQALAKFAIDDVLAKEMPADGTIQAPQTRTVTAGGVEWTVVSARGLAGGNKEGWGSMERRFYMTPMGSSILYVDAYARLSTDAEDKAAFWAAIEGITLPAKK